MDLILGPSALGRGEMAAHGLINVKDECPDTGLQRLGRESSLEATVLLGLFTPRP